MKKVFILLIGLFAFGWQAQGMTGSGTATDPFLISTYEDLKLIKNSISSVYRIVADIDASASVLDNDGAGFEPIGTFSTTPFSGTLSAGGHTIRNLTINRSGQDFVGLFGYLNGSATVDSLALVGVNISGKSYVGALAGISAAKITNCFSSGSVTGTGQYIGGLVGDNYSSSCSIAYSYSTCSVTGDSSVGGLAGFNVKTVSNCYASGPVSGNSSVGGLVGQLYGSSSVVNSYSVGLVTGNTNVGGLVGINNGTVTNSRNNFV